MWARHGNDRKVAADLHSSVNLRQRPATAVGRENVPICVRSENFPGRVQAELNRTREGWNASWTLDRLAVTPRRSRRCPVVPAEFPLAVRSRLESVYRL